MLQAKKLSLHHTLRWLLVPNLLKLARMNNKKSIQGGRGGTWSLKSVQGSPQGLGFYNLQMLWKVSMELLKQKIIVQLDLTETKICRTDKKGNYMGYESYQKTRVTCWWEKFLEFSQVGKTFKDFGEKEDFVKWICIKNIPKAENTGINFQGRRCRGKFPGDYKKMLVMGNISRS